MLPNEKYLLITAAVTLFSTFWVFVSLSFYFYNSIQTILVGVGLWAHWLLRNDCDSRYGDITSAPEKRPLGDEALPKVGTSEEWWHGQADKRCCSGVEMVYP